MNSNESAYFNQPEVPGDAYDWRDDPKFGYRIDHEGAEALNSRLVYNEAGNSNETTESGYFNTQPVVSEEISEYYAHDTELTWKEKAHNAGQAIAEDIKDSKHPIATTIFGLGTLATQGANFLRISVVVVPEVASRVLDSTHSPAWTALAAGGANFLISTSVGELAIQGLKKFTRTVDALSDTFPKLAGFLQNNLPGFKEKESSLAQEDRSFSRRILSGSIMHIKRALNGMSVSSGMYALTAKTLGYTTAEERKVNIGLGVDTSVLVGGIAWKLGDYVNNLAVSGNYEKVKTIESWIGNTKNWWAVAGALMLVGGIQSKFERRKLAKTLKENDFPAKLPE